jgi:hypothetical protein
VGTWAVPQWFHVNAEQERERQRLRPTSLLMTIKLLYGNGDRFEAKTTWSSTDLHERTRKEIKRELE